MACASSPTEKRAPACLPAPDAQRRRLSIPTLCAPLPSITATAPDVLGLPDDAEQRFLSSPPYSPDMETWRTQVESPPAHSLELMAADGYVRGPDGVVRVAAASGGAGDLRSVVDSHPGGTMAAPPIIVESWDSV